MPHALPFSGWRLRYWFSDPAPGWPLRCARELCAALPGAEVLVEPDPEADALTLTPPAGTPAFLVHVATSAACRAVERAHRAGLA